MTGQISTANGYFAAGGRLLRIERDAIDAPVLVVEHKPYGAELYRKVVEIYPDGSERILKAESSDYYADCAS